MKAVSENGAAAGSDVRVAKHGGELNGEATEVQRRAVIAYLGARFGDKLSHDDIEDLAQEAWAEVLERRGRGERINDVVAYMRSVVWRDARDLIRDSQETAVDPGDLLLVGMADHTGRPEERIDRRADLARAIEAVEQLEPVHRAAYRARFVDELSTSDACKRLGLPRSTYHHRLRRALDAVHATLESDRFAVLQLKLLGAYVAGVASFAERRRAERLIRNDPQSAAIARELRATHEATAAALTPVAVAPDASVGLVERLAGLPERLRDAVGSAGGRGQEAAEAAGTTLASGGGTRGAGAAGAGVFAKLAGLGGAGKIAAACLGTGAAATACVAAGVVPGVALGPTEPANGASPDLPAAQAPRPAVDSVAPSVLPSQVGGDDARPAASQEDASAPAPPVEEEPTPEPVAPEAPAVEQEVGVASAATPTGGSGGTSGGAGGGGSAVQREFGP